MTNLKCAICGKQFKHPNAVRNHTRDVHGKKAEPKPVEPSLADETLEGAMCSQCGTYMGQPVGHPRTCPDCARPEKALSGKELKEAAQMIRTQHKAAVWLASLSRNNTIWCVELESSGLEVLVSYSSKHRECSDFEKTSLGADNTKAITTNPHGVELLAKYGLHFNRPKPGLLADRTSPRW